MPQSLQIDAKNSTIVRFQVLFFGFNILLFIERAPVSVWRLNPPEKLSDKKYILIEVKNKFVRFIDAPGLLEIDIQKSGQRKRAENIFVKGEKL